MPVCCLSCVQVEKKTRVSWEEWVLRSPCDSDDEADRPAYSSEMERPERWNVFALENAAWDRAHGILQMDREHRDHERLRYLQEHVHPDVLKSMRAWGHEAGIGPAAVGDAGMLWLQRFLVARDARRRSGVKVPGYGPRGLCGLAQALGVVCYGCGPDVDDVTRGRAGNAFVILYVRALRRHYFKARVSVVTVL
jgi:hypothetical protein